MLFAETCGRALTLALLLTAIEAVLHLFALGYRDSPVFPPAIQIAFLHAESVEASEMGVLCLPRRSLTAAVQPHAIFSLLRLSLSPMRGSPTPVAVALSPLPVLGRCA